MWDLAGREIINFDSPISVLGKYLKHVLDFYHSEAPISFRQAKRYKLLVHLPRSFRVLVSVGVLSFSWEKIVSLTSTEQCTHVLFGLEVVLYESKALQWQSLNDALALEFPGIAFSPQ